MRLRFVIIISIIHLTKPAFQLNQLEITVCYYDSSKFEMYNKKPRVIDVNIGSTIHLWCRYCDIKANYYPKLWFYRPRGNEYLNQTMQEIVTNDDFVINDTYIAMSHTLTLTYFKANNSGIYMCKNSARRNDHNFTYVLDGTINVDVIPNVGTRTQWQEYKRLYIDPVNEKFKSSMEEPYYTFRSHYNIIMNVYTVWSNWSECKNTYNRQKAVRKRLGKCRIGPLVNNTLKIKPENATFNVVTSYLNDGYDIPCRSLKLKELLPTISRIIRNIPEFEAEETCSIPQNGLNSQLRINKDKNNIKHKSIQQVMENSHVTLTCNEVMPDSDLKWFKDKKLLKSLYGNIFHKREDEPHISIDAYNSLHILHISKNEEGNYTCSINGKKVKQYEVRVLSQSKLLNQEFIRYSIYLGFVLSLTMTCYCAGVCVAWHRRGSFADPLNLYKKNPNTNSRREIEKLLR